MSKMQYLLCRALLMGCAIIGLNIAATVAAPAYAQEATRSYQISAQDLDDALREFARQTGRDVLFTPDVVATKRSSGVHGRMTEVDALNTLLTGTGLRFEQTQSNGYVVRDPTPAPQLDPANLPRSSLPEEGVVVTGSRIRGTVNTAAPSKVIDREEIERSGISTVEAVLQTLPQNFSEISSVGGAFQDGTSNLALRNSDYASAANLRGLGAESTLTLLNGTRRAGSSDGRVVDLSMIPLLAVDQIEVVTGGRSAIYGADAVAGVVNILTRRHFDGVEAGLSYGFADSGGERFQINTIGGREYSRGGFVAAYDYQEESALNAVEAGYTRPNFGNFPVRLDVQPESKRHSGYLSGTLDLNERVELYADGLWTTKDLDTATITVNAGAPFFATNPSTNDFALESEIYSLSIGARVTIANWQLEVAGATSNASTEEFNANIIDIGVFGVLQSEAQQHREASVTSVSAVFDGPLGEIAGMTPRAAIGAEYRTEDYERAGEVDFGGFVSTSQAANDRDVNSLFAELTLPFIASDNRRLELSLAGRYDDYDDFGDTFNPQAGILWSPTKDFVIRAAYGSAFRAPVLVDLVPSSTAFVQERTDPLSPTGFTPVLTLQGTNPALQPEEADTWSAGFDWEPSFATWLQLSVSYFDVEYDGRINIPALGADDFLVLEREARFGDLINRTPTLADIAAIGAQLVQPIDNFTGTPWDPSAQTILEAFPNLVVFDNRAANISTESAQGVDLSVDTTFETDIGQLTFGANMTYMIDHTANITVQSPSVDRLNEVGKPVDFRARATAGWQRGPYAATFFVNYVGEYTNPFTTPESTMEPWTTVDMSLQFDGNQLPGAMKGFEAALSVSNIFKNGPSELLHDNGRFFAYDPTNANAFGRYITVSLTKRW